MKQRLNIKELEPKAFEILIAMEQYLATSQVPRQMRELIKIRASQINKCAYCLAMHTTDARKAGETEQRIYALSAWEESPHFSDEERAVLTLTEEVTRISEHGVREETFQELRKYFNEHQIAQMILTINQINFWNRNAVATKSVYSEN